MSIATVSGRVHALRSTLTAAALGLVAASGLHASSSVSAAESAAESATTTETTKADKVLRIPVRTDGPRSLDPVRGSTVYDNMAACQFYETLLINSYYDPQKLEPLLLAEMPVRSEDGLTWSFKLKPNVAYHTDPCFKGATRTVKSDDVFFSLKRMADPANGGKSWWLLKDTILGFDEYKAEQEAAGTFNYDAPVPGFVKIDDLNFEIKLQRPVYRFMWVLSMFQTSVIPREAVEFYGDEFREHPVGTGPFVLDEWVRKQSLTANKNPNYHAVAYPERDKWSRDDRRRRLHRAAGQMVPFLDRVEITFFGADPPMWLNFVGGKLDFVQVPAENYDEVFDRRTRELRTEWVEKEIAASRVPLLDFIFIGFNMDDELLGGFSDRATKLRRAIGYALDWDERNEVFYNGTVIVYDGMIPPQLDGHPEGHKSEAAARGPNLEKAAQLLAEAGYPNGDGLDPIRYFTDNSGNSNEQVELLKRQLARVGIRLQPQLVDFSTLIETVDKRNAPMFSFAWGSDYPDAENNMALFYSPNASPGSNHYNYANPEFDALYEKLVVMEPSEERTELIVKMRDMVLSDTPYLGSMARTRSYLIQPQLLNCRPTEMFWSWFKFLDIDTDDN